jgi:hypothetical protein
MEGQSKLLGIRRYQRGIGGRVGAQVVIQVRDMQR